MITKAIYDEIASQWEGKPYQNWPRLKQRLPLFEKNILPHLAGKRVFEIGCNAGIYAWHIAPIAKSYTGIDGSERYIRDAQITAKYIQGAPVSFIYSMLGDFAFDELSFDAVLASFLLYHLSDEEVEIFEKEIAPRCDVLAVQIRRKAKSRNSYDFMQAKNVEALFDRAGFDCQIFWANWWHSAFAALGTKR
jgi:2-polyprenyl-3-methyl-5-hydroxy-6-metoxy-1,4-benzoquinol methylase